MSTEIVIPPTFKDAGHPPPPHEPQRTAGNVCYAFDPEKPGEREMLRHLSLLPGTKVSKFMGFTFISVDDPERAVWKYRLIRRLEAERRMIEATRPPRMTAEQMARVSS